ncbi:AzlC family ABC transporter permease [Pontimonas sp.]|uniref:AzlC family ABC transporter permease n=1 Tax=Pontimonas sp. TaxID=2304492 RepID=UPI0028707DFA|nr:AzlC family ABC transporter permease [Pontimonas sp.]MDR9395894.1 AzlC family ABC transporter permease [Pontimonas sp.]MDR9434129.1 AzlC family ABC transporter permease [Pontimonas sp.]
MTASDSSTARARAQGLQVALAVSLYGVSFGALAVTSGFSLWQTMVLSLVMFSGASQFALIGIIATGGAAAGLAAVLSAGLLGIRNSLYALRMSPLVGARGGLRVIAAHLTIDESTAVGSAQTSVAAGRVGFWTTGVGLFIGWNLMTLLGALLGNVLGDVRTYGLDAAAAAAFLGLVWPWLTRGEPVVAAVAAAVLTVALVPALPTGVPVLVVALTAIAFGLYRHRVAPQAPPREEVTP